MFPANELKNLLTILVDDMNTLVDPECIKLANDELDMITNKINELEKRLKKMEEHSEWVLANWGPK